MTSFISIPSRITFSSQYHRLGTQNVQAAARSCTTIPFVLYIPLSFSCTHDVPYAHKGPFLRFLANDPKNPKGKCFCYGVRFIIYSLQRYPLKADRKQVLRGPRANLLQGGRILNPVELDPAADFQNLARLLLFEKKKELSNTTKPYLKQKKNVYLRAYKIFRENKSRTSDFNNEFHIM